MTTGIRLPMSGLARDILVSVLLLTLALVLRSWLVHSMTLHMLIHIPMLLVGGIFLGLAAARVITRAPDRSIVKKAAAQVAACNRYGVSGLLCASLVGLYWMIPKALDGVLLFPAAEVSKFVSVILAGVCLSASWARADRVIKLFFVGGFCWMTAIAGMLYQESSTRLCNFYLLNDQVWAGRGLVILAVMIPVCWLLAEMRQHGVRQQASGETRATTQEQP